VAENLAERFMASGAEPIEFEGRFVHLRLDMVDLPRCRLVVSLEANRERPQALCMAAQNGVLEVNGGRSKGVVLWADTAPPVINVDALPGRSGLMSVRLWNAWRDARGVQHAGIGNAGVLTGRNGDLITLRCSDGFGEPTFEDLVVVIRRVPLNGAE
jgi:hypothetical protein